MTEENAGWPLWLKETMRTLPRRADNNEGTHVGEDKAGRLFFNRTWATEAGVSARHLHKLSEASCLVETRSLQLAKAFVYDKKQWCLALLRHHGVGKTFAGEWVIVQHLSNGGRSVQLVTPGDIRERSRLAEHRQSMLGKNILVIDDLGSEPTGSLDSFRSQLIELINHRWRYEKATVLTSNLSAAAFQSRYGRRIIDRMLDGGRCVAVTGPNLRA